MNKVSKTFRLSPTTIRRIDYLKARLSLDATATVEKCIEYSWSEHERNLLGLRSLPFRVRGADEVENSDSAHKISPAKK